MELYLYRDSMAQHIKDYLLSDEQLQFTTHPNDAIKRSQTDDDIRPILAFHNEQLVTFFSLYTNAHLKKYTTNPQAILLGSFSTALLHQGCGYAKDALQLVNSFIQDNMPSITEIYLGVNTANIAAQTLYNTCGYHATGGRFEGRFGEVTIMKQTLYY
ncbi:GNAT family N-acetyltransferase [Kurthia sibirica]|uniref:GNAT family N-acetyltransferase n=1 Tax=Kurthia sibirica TaxID=202750 RepID=A0A2U3AJK9_9BACL|nr:GNAT family N-acetyltransferase [Kurthia sibirica]PWI24736.1 GNAT family N-acetyltransferase [Kurthia sibirica]GEK34766.1 hypothetical protein KSI01_22990 [Kurthia sibirica]